METVTADTGSMSLSSEQATAPASAIAPATVEGESTAAPTTAAAGDSSIVDEENKSSVSESGVAADSTVNSSASSSSNSSSASNSSTSNSSTSNSSTSSSASKPAPSPTTMNAVFREGMLGPKIVFKTGVPVSLSPPSTAGQLVVRVLAAGINPVDYKLPKIAGGARVAMDFAGTVIAVHPSSTFKVGDEVYGHAKGSLAEYAVCDEKQISYKPKSLSFVEAAALPVVYITAIQGFQQFLQKGHNVLVIGASGGAGLAALHVARFQGAAEIVAVCSAKNAELVKQQGATRVIDYNVDKISTVHQKWGAEFPQKYYDVVYDAATASGHGEDYYAEAQKVLKPGGKIVCLNGPASAWIRKFTGLQAADRYLFLANINTADLAKLTNMIDSGEEKKGPTFRPVIARALPFNEQNVTAAFDFLKSRRAAGKIVLQMDENASASNSQTPHAQITESKSADPGQLAAVAESAKPADVSGQQQEVPTTQQADGQEAAESTKPDVTDDVSSP